MDAMKVSTRVLVAAFTIAALLAPLASSASETPPPPPSEKLEAEGDDGPGIKKIQAKRDVERRIVDPPHPVKPLGGPGANLSLLGEVTGGTGGFVAIGSGGASAQVAAIEKSLRRLARELR